MKRTTVLTFVVVALLFFAAPATKAARFANLSPVIEGALVDSAKDLDDGLFESVDISGDSLRVQAGPATVDVTRVFMEFDISDFIDADKVQAASMVMTSAVTSGDPSGPLTHALCLPHNCPADMSDGFAARTLGTFPFADGTLSIDVSGFVQQQIASGVTSIAFLLRAHENVERDWDQIQQFFRSSRFEDETVQPRLAMFVASPEPGSVFLMASGLLLVGWFGYRRRERRKAA